MNRFEILFLAVGVLFNHAESHAQSAPLSVPLPCQSAIRQHKSLVAPEDDKAAALYGACDCADPREVGDNPADACPLTPNNQRTPGVKYDLADALVQSIVRGRIHNLYLGIDSLNDGNVDLTQAKPFTQAAKSGEFFKSETKAGFGSCAHVGACNQFCGEGGAPARGMTRSSTFPTSSQLSFNFNSLKPNSDNNFQNSDPDKGGHGWVPNRSPEKLFLGLNNYADPNTLRVKLSDFFAFGVLNDPTTGGARQFRGSTASPGSENLPSVTPTATPSATVHSLTADGWPLQSVSNTSSGGNICRTSSPSDQNDLRSHIGHCFRDAQHYKLKNLSWDDTSFPTAVSSDGGEGRQCDYQYSIDFQYASTISSLQAGALVQATWTALDQVVREIIDTHKIELRDKCRSVASDATGGGFKRNLLAASRVLIREKIENGGYNTNPDYMSTRQDYTELRSKCAAPIGSGSKTTDQVNCDKLGLITLLQGSNFVELAQCEVLDRAQKLYDKAFLGEGRKWLNQIKNWAAASCMAEGDSLFEHDRPSGDCYGAAYGTCVGATIGVGAFFCHYLVAGVIYDPANTDRCFMDNNFSDMSCAIPRSNSLYKDFLGSGKAKMGNCFPYAYSAALQAYLQNLGFNPNNGQGSSNTPIQFNYRSRRTVNNSPALEISNCQLTDKTEKGQSIPDRDALPRQSK